jgi:hypothetical protein
VKAHQPVDIRDRGKAAFDRRNRVGIRQAADADRDIGSKKRPGPLNDRKNLLQSAFS